MEAFVVVGAPNSMAVLSQGNTTHGPHLFVPIILEQRKQRQTPRSPNLEDPVLLEIAFHRRFTLSHCEFLGKDPDSCHCTRLPSPSRSQNLKRENITRFSPPAVGNKSEGRKSQRNTVPRQFK